MHVSKSTLALFDFDGTLTRGDTLPRFVIFHLGFARALLYTACLAFDFAGLWLSGKWSLDEAKKIGFKRYFKGYSEKELRNSGEAFCRDQLPRILRNDILEKMRAFRDSGAKVAVVSASFDIWLLPFCKAEGVDLLCTEIAWDEGVFRGEWATPNCNRAEKARRISEKYDLRQYSDIVAFGNSSGDDHMLALATVPHKI